MKKSTGLTAHVLYNVLLKYSRANGIKKFTINKHHIVFESGAFTGLIMYSIANYTYVRQTIKYKYEYAFCVNYDFMTLVSKLYKNDLITRKDYIDIINSVVIEDLKISFKQIKRVKNESTSKNGGAGKSI